MRLLLLAIFFSIVYTLPAQAHKPVSKPIGTSASDEQFSFTAAAGREYAMGAAGSEVYTFVEDPSSPTILAIQLPNEGRDASGYLVSFLTKAGFSRPVKEAVGAKVSTFANTTGVKITLLNNKGAQLVTPEDFAFYLSFAESGYVTAHVTGNEPPIRNTYIPTILPLGGNPPIGKSLSQ